ncbi:FAD-dependent monooxygenase [Pannonibacter sp. Pt2-lr]
MSSLVCVVTPETATHLKAYEDGALALELERRAHSVLGAFRIASPRQVYPLSGMIAKKAAANRCALIGEAAHVFPPIGAQGLNLGLRDVADLARIVGEAKARGEDVGSALTLARYDSARKPDITSRTTAVDLLNRSLLTDMLPVQALRSSASTPLAASPCASSLCARGSRPRQRGCCRSKGRPSPLSSCHGLIVAFIP